MSCLFIHDFDNFSANIIADLLRETKLYQVYSNINIQTNNKNLIQDGIHDKSISCLSRIKIKQMLDTIMAGNYYNIDRAYKNLNSDINTYLRVSKTWNLFLTRIKKHFWHYLDLTEYDLTTLSKLPDDFLFPVNYKGKLDFNQTNFTADIQEKIRKMSVVDDEYYVNYLIKENLNDLIYSETINCIRLFLNDLSGDNFIALSNFIPDIDDVFFDSLRDVGKNIYVIRNPVSIYIDQYYDSNLSDKMDYIFFCDNLKRRVFNKKIYKSNSLYISYNDLIYNHESTKKQIFAFLGISLKDHIMPNLFFNPSEYKRIENRYSRFINSEAISYINAYPFENNLF